MRQDNLPTLIEGMLQAARLTVYTPFPTIMHTCREAREFVLRKGGIGRIELVHLEDVDCDVPLRTFDPLIDTLYWPATQHMSFSDYLDGYNGVNPALDASQARQLRHLAIEWGMMNAFPLRLVEYILQSCPDLETISVVFPHLPNMNKWTDRFPPPAGRCRLRQLTDVEESTMMIMLPNLDLDWYASLRPNPEGPQLASVEEFVMSLRISLDTYGELALKRMLLRYTGNAWNAEERRFERPVLISKMFTEYRAGSWVLDIGKPEADEKAKAKGDTSKQQGTLRRLYSSLRRS
jgi:hypothetical protein